MWDIVAGTGSASETLYAGRQSVPDILADTNELQAELADGGRTDLILDGIATDTDTIIAALPTVSYRFLIRC